tara:strand:+ start:1488 stop:2291 length:804 start_codon:yes stop_codon:yes gene_type:complete
MRYLIFDLSYYTFYRFFATKQWYKHANKDEVFEDGYDYTKNTIFWEKYSKMFIENIHKLIKKFKIEKVIFAKDCPRDQIWRSTIYNKYKSNRDNSNSGIGNVFKKTYSDILPFLLVNDKIQLISIPQLEADDIIYLTTKQIINNLQNDEIWIVSSDQDLLQIIEPNITLIDAKMKPYNNKSYGSKDRDIFMKCIMGDSSDYIEQAFPKRTMGNKKAIKCIDDYDSLIDNFRKYPGSFDKFAFNNLLIDFRNIPEELVLYYNENYSIE